MSASKSVMDVLPNVLGDAIVKQKFVDAHWVVLSRGLSFVLSERPTAYEVFYADAERNISAGTATCVATNRTGAGRLFFYVMR